MAKERIKPCGKLELDLFTSRPTQVAIERGYWEELQLSNSLTDEGPYQFRIPPDPNYLKLSQHWLRMVMQITKADGSPIVQADDVASVQLIGSTFFRNMRIKIMGKEIYDANGLYAYRSLLEVLLNYGTDAKNTHLQAALYYNSKKERAKWFHDSVEVETMSPLYCDLFEQEKYLLSNVDLQIELWRNSDEFLLLTPPPVTGSQSGEGSSTQATKKAERYKIKLKAMSLFVRKAELTKNLHLAITERLNRGAEARYALRRVKMTTQHVAAGCWSTPTTALFTSQLPRRVFVVCVNSDAYNGRYHLDPFLFEHFNLRSAKITAGGQAFPDPPYTLDITKGIYVRAYLGLFDALGFERDNRGNGINRRDFVNGFTVLGFDLTPDSDDGPHFQIIKDGSLTLQLEFAAPIPPPGIEVIILGEYDNEITINESRNPKATYIVS